MTDTLATFDRVTKKYGFFDALRGISFDLREGEVFGYIGPNGAGKTTTLKILVGLIEKFGGTLTIAGRRVPEHRGAVHPLIGFLPQAVGFHSWRTAEQAMTSLGELSGVPRDVLARDLERLLERFSLAEFRHKKINKLSGGMQQKLGFVQALLHRPKLLVLDEPLAGLDPASRNLVKAVLEEVRAEGTTVIFSSHILSDVQDLADRIGVIQRGTIVTTGTVQELKRQFGAPVVVELRFARAPTDDSFLREDEVFGACERHGKTWRLQLRDPEAFDHAVHHVIERTLAADGRIRSIARFEPDLDDLYVRYIDAHGEGAEAPKAPKKTRGAREAGGEHVEA